MFPNSRWRHVGGCGTFCDSTWRRTKFQRHKESLWPYPRSPWDPNYFWLTASGLVDDNLNINTNGPKGDYQDEDNIIDMVTTVPKDMSVHFLTLHTKTWVRYSRTWIMTHLGQEVHFSMDYLMINTISCFKKLSDR